MNITLSGANPKPSVRYQVVHITSYKYASSVTASHHFAHLSPRDTEHQKVLSHELSYAPTPDEIQALTDYFGNGSYIFQITVPHDELKVTARSLVDVYQQQLPEEFVGQHWEQVLPADASSWERADIAEMRLPSQHVECLDLSLSYAQRFFTPGRPWLEAMLEMTRQIREEFIYDAAATTISTPISEVFENKHGVCQDFAHLMLSCLRALKLPARYVSGYILNEPPPGKKKLLGSDASHAWVESWFPGLGWVGFDPTNGKQANTDFITLAWGRDFMDVTPLRGVVLGGGSPDPHVSVSVTPIAV